MRVKPKRAILCLAAIVATAWLWVINDVSAMRGISAQAGTKVNNEELSYEMVSRENLYRGDWRATNKFDWRVQPSAASKAPTALSLESGESVTINSTFSPKKADIDFGLIDPNGQFRHAKGKDGNFEMEIQAMKSGKYCFAVRNNTDQTVAVMGFVYY